VGTRCVFFVLFCALSQLCITSYFYWFFSKKLAL
jgi:hypothetical protein